VSDHRGQLGAGFATAHPLAAEGAKVVIVARTAAKADAAAKAIADLAGGTPIDWLAADSAVQQQMRDLAAEFGHRYSRLDVLVNNAGAILR